LGLDTIIEIASKKQRIHLLIQTEINGVHEIAPGGVAN